MPAYHRADVVAKLVDVFPNWRTIRVAEGIVRVHYPQGNPGS